jgi:hypothetical protein
MKTHANLLPCPCFKVKVLRNSGHDKQRDPLFLDCDDNNIVRVDPIADIVTGLFQYLGMRK